MPARTQAFHRCSRRCVDCRGKIIDPVDEIVDRVEKALEHVTESDLPEPRLRLRPRQRPDIPIDQAYAKLLQRSQSAILRERQDNQESLSRHM